MVDLLRLFLHLIYQKILSSQS